MEQLSHAFQGITFITFILSVAVLVTFFVMAYRLRLLIKELKKIRMHIPSLHALAKVSQHAKHSRTCPYCRAENFYSENQPSLCMSCHSALPAPNTAAEGWAHIKDNNGSFDVPMNIIRYWPKSYKDQVEIIKPSKPEPKEDDPHLGI